MKKRGFLYPITIVPLAFLLVSFYACIAFHYGPYSGHLMGNVPSSKSSPTLAEQLGFTKDSIIVIVHADDIGMHIDQTDGAFEAMKYGMVKTGSIMVPCPDFDRTATIGEKNMAGGVFYLKAKLPAYTTLRESCGRSLIN